MAETGELKNVDRRTLERQLRHGTIDDKAYERYLKSLPDVAEKMATVETQMTDTDEDFDDEGEE
jgi:hypothetical protein